MPNRPDQKVYGPALVRETILSERQRAVALAVVLGVITLGISAFFLVVPSFGAMMPGMNAWSPLKTYGPFLLFEVIIIVLIGRRIARGQDLPIGFRYLSALVEVSLPSVVLLAHINRMGVAGGLGFFAPLLYSVFIILSTLRLDFWLAAFTGAAAAIEMFAIAYFHLPGPGPTAAGMAGGMGTGMAMGAALQNAQFTAGYHLSRSAALLAAGVVAGWVALRLRHQFDATMQAVVARDNVTNLFGQHVSPQVVDRLLATGGEKASELRRVAVMFVDIRGFTAAAQKRSPAEVVSRLDAAFTVMVEVIDAHGGVVNKFLGDGFLAIFGAPVADERATKRAVAAGRELLAVVKNSNAGHPDWPIQIGIGLHVGEAVTGIVGSPRRKEYTVIGNTVNLAARIEALNKEVGSRFLLSDAARAELGEDAADAHPLGDVMVRGYDSPTFLWQLA